MSPAKLSFSTDTAPAFFDASHRALTASLSAKIPSGLDDGPASLVARRLGGMGLYAYLVPEVHGGAKVGKPTHSTYVDVRSLVLIREALGQLAPMADSIFAVQGLGSYPIAVAGSDVQCAKYLPDIIAGHHIGAFALTEPEAGSDVSAMRATARRDGDDWVLDGEKVFISNVPIAKHYVVFANIDRSIGRKGITAFIVERDTPGLELASMPMSVPHPLGRLTLKACRVPHMALLGGVGSGFKLAMTTLDTFRISVGAAAAGMAARALSETISYTTKREQFGVRLAEHQIVRAYLAEMATELDASRLLVARAAHLRDTTGQRVTAEAAMAKMYATEAAQRIIDKAVQLHGGSGVVLGSDVEKLYREIRPLRIYEGTTEVQKLVIAKALLDAAAAAS